MSSDTRYRSRPITKADFDFIVRVVDHWWDGPIAILAHPVFFYELGGHARVVEDSHNDGEVVGFLLGFIARGSERIGGDVPRTEDVGYVHLVGIHPQHRRQGVGRALYGAFIETCRAAGCTQMKAVTLPGNVGSQRFHRAIGWDIVEDVDYAGQGRKRVVMTLGL
ncbi:MAG: GNAT family N-acetyltransferase [Polyangiales bacterium]